MVNQDTLVLQCFRNKTLVSLILIYLSNLACFFDIMDVNFIKRSNIMHGHRQVHTSALRTGWQDAHALSCAYRGNVVHKLHKYFLMI